MKKVWIAMMFVPSLALAEAPPPAPAAGGAAPAKMEAPKPYAELEQLKFFAGNWSCDGKAPASPMGPAHDFKATNNAKWELDGFWMMHSREVKKSKDMPMSFVGRAWNGWDKAASKFVFAGADNMGGWINLTSTGWTGDKMVYEGDSMMMSGKKKVRLSFMKGKTPNEMTAEFAVGDDKGGWNPPITESCKKGK
jgi:hypothetical protein